MSLHHTWQAHIAHWVIRTWIQKVKGHAHVMPGYG